MNDTKQRKPEELTKEEILRRLNEIYYQLGLLRGRIDNCESKINNH